MFDMALALLFIPAVFPVCAIIALLIKLDSPGPVLFMQTRNGRAKRPFRMLKFRTMYVGARHGERMQARRADPRVTRIGRVLRALSLDELPQLVNVLKGEMSLVGPRPHIPAHDAEFAAALPHYDARFVVKPGMTGLAQVRGWRGEITNSRALAARLAADLHYVRTRSLWLDCKIMAATALRIWRDERAY